MWLSASPSAAAAWSVCMPKGLEIERKFLVKLPDLSSLNVKRTVSITQTYLRHGENGSQRRVRRLAENGSVSYTYTEKVFITHSVREENESKITEQKYLQLLSEMDTACAPVEKVRTCFSYHGQLFELDVYPFSDQLAIMELELESLSQNIDFPEDICVLKDVSDDHRYSNAALANAGRFPENMEELNG